MGAGASAKLKETSDADITTALSELSAEDKAKILEQLKGPTGEKSAENKAKITANKAKLHELESVVLGNKQKLYAERSFIEENRLLILKNYTAAFLGNRQMANQNTEDIFRNRKSIVKHYKADDAVKINFAESRLNEARIDYLEHRAKMNAKVAAVNEKMVKINALLIEVNDETMANNQELVDFNTKHVEINTKLLSGDLVFKNSDGSAASPEKNQERIDRNASRIAEIVGVAKDNSAKHAELLIAAKANKELILENSKAIYERREAIEKNHEAIAANATKIATWIGGEK